MSDDPTEAARREMILKGEPYADLKQTLDDALPTWDSDELRRDFDVLGFLAPFVHVRRKCDGVEGSLEFTHSPRLYFNFVRNQGV